MTEEIIKPEIKAELSRAIKHLEVDLSEDSIWTWSPDFVHKPKFSPSERGYRFWIGAMKKRIFWYDKNLINPRAHFEQRFFLQATLYYRSKIKFTFSPAPLVVDMPPGIYLNIHRPKLGGFLQDFYDGSAGTYGPSAWLGNSLREIQNLTKELPLANYLEQRLHSWADNHSINNFGKMGYILCTEDEAIENKGTEKLFNYHRPREN
jgi:hypothetical protein